MAAPQIAGTPAPAPEAAEVAAPNAADEGIGALLGDITGADLDDSEETPAGDDSEVTEAAETDATEPTDPARGLDDEVIFSEKSLTTKEGVLRAKARIGQLRKLTHDKYVELKGYEGKVIRKAEKLKVSRDRFVGEKQQHDLLLNNVRANLKGLHSGDPDTILTALGHLTGQDGFKTFEQLNSRLINRGQPKIDPQIQQVIDGLRQEVEDLKGGLNERETQGKQQQLHGRLQQHRQTIGARITGAAEQLPHLARLYADDPNGVTEYIMSAIEEAHAKGAPVDGNRYFGNLESELAAHYARASAPKGDGGGPAPKQPAPAQRSPGQSFGPRSAAASNPRVPSEEEALRALADDEVLMSQFGL